MKHQRQTFVASFLLFVAIILHSTRVRADEIEDEGGFDYIEGSPKGPQHWGELKTEWATCKDGKMQSPIDLSCQHVKVLPCSANPLKTNYKPSKTTIVNRGHDISLRWEGDAGSIDINGTHFYLQQVHWHSPSEHSINGKRFNLEMHMVHPTKEADGNKKIAVVGLLFEIGSPDPLLSKLSKHMLRLAKRNDEKKVGVIDPSEINRGGESYYRYIGSLTTPPCSEGVIWTIDPKIRTVSREQIKTLREAVHEDAESNARPQHPLNGRDLLLYGSEKN
ncbi:hypothetical protein L6164_009732 [Bauhinia variegata]|uniref:Uncharacterized protein n=1 Tax=Bauhinia variegata TaxID=167791 RepID=A0ACB9PKL9_BAUVA|nr:hypothetical protein L6164_009732 [Bauhinia variegata]